MSELWTAVSDKAPNLAVLAFIVWIFLKHLKSYNSFLRDLQNENVEARKHSREVIEKNTEAMGKNTEALREMSQVLMLKQRP